MTVVSIPPVRPEPFDRTWSARTDDRCYRVVARVETETCTDPPVQYTAEFAGHGELTVAEYRAGVDAHLATLGFRIIDVRLEPMSRDDYDRAVAPPAAAAPDPQPEPLAIADFVPAGLPVKPRRRGRRR